MALIDQLSADFAARHGNPASWLTKLRRDAFERFAAVGLPTPALEEWKYTNLAALAQRPLRQPIAGAHAIARALVQQVSLANVHRIVFVDGHWVQEWSDGLAADPGLEVLDLAGAASREPELLRRALDRASSGADDALVDLNTAFASDGVLLKITRGAELARPIQIIVATSSAAGDSACFPRIVIVAESGSRASVIETYASVDGVASFTDAVTQSFVAENAELRHCRIQREGNGTFHVGSLFVEQQRDSRFASHLVSFGGHLSRTEIRALLDGSGAECSLDGLYVGTGTQHHDLRTTIDHARPHTTSNEVYKGVLDDRAHGVFNGKVYVRPQAMKTDARQLNNNLLLSDDAEVDSKPQLEIFADDVKCSHGATIGRLSDDSLFYLRARGIDAAAARAILIRAFANEMIERIRFEPLQADLASLLHDRLAAHGTMAQRCA